MAEEMVVTFPGNLKVQAQINEFTIETDQSKESGGDGSAPSPFALFIASVATCSGFFAMKFCRARNIETEGMSLLLKYSFDEKTKRYPEMEIQLKLPGGFPEKYKEAIIRAMDQCSVKKLILDPPDFKVTLT